MIDFGLDGDQTTPGTTITESTVLTLLPKDEVLLAVDPSKSSTGYALSINGVLHTGTITVQQQSGFLAESLMRRDLAYKLFHTLNELGVDHVDTVLIEDVYFGGNTDVVRLLLSLNTAIDDVFLDSDITFGTALRVNNVTWKSWLTTLYNGVKGMSDKEKVVSVLNELDFYTESQDIYDATGILTGYLINREVDKPTPDISLSIKDLEFRYADTIEELLKMLPSSGIPITGKPSKRLILQRVSGNKEGVFYFETPKYLGFFGEELGIPPKVTPGYLGFWKKRKDD